MEKRCGYWLDKTGSIQEESYKIEMIIETEIENLRIDMLKRK
jgi:hypothetical protein